MPAYGFVGKLAADMEARHAEQAAEESDGNIEMRD